MGKSLELGADIILQIAEEKQKDKSSFDKFLFHLLDDYKQYNKPSRKLIKELLRQHLKELDAQMGDGSSAELQQQTVPELPQQ